MQQPQNIIRLLDASYVDGVIYCRIMREPRTTVLGNNFDLINNKYHLLVAAGSSLKRKILLKQRNFLDLSLSILQLSFIYIENSVGYHTLGRLAASSPAYLADVAIVGGRSKLFIRLHAAFMITAWIGTASVGILLARYFKQTWVGSQLCGKDQWFAVSIDFYIKCLLQNYSSNLFSKNTFSVAQNVYGADMGINDCCFCTDLH